MVPLTPAVHSNVLADRENHLSAITDPCQAQMTVHTMTNKLHSFSINLDQGQCAALVVQEGGRERLHRLMGGMGRGLW